MLEQTRAIPVVFVIVADPVGSGFVQSLARPGANATGFTIMEPTIAGKWLELLKEISPHVNRAAFLFNPATTGSFQVINRTARREANASMVRCREIDSRSRRRPPKRARPEHTRRIRRVGAAATANASATNGGSAVAQATGGGWTNIGLPGGFPAGPASATATSTAMLGGTANATATATGGGFFGTAVNANSSATTINGNAAQAKSFATSSLATGQAQAIAQTNFGNFTSVQAKSTSPASGGTVSAIAQAGGIVSPSNPIIAGQSFSVVSGSGFGPLTVANGSMGAGYFGTGTPLTYQESVSFTQNGGAFVLDLLSNDALGIGFDSALLQISLNGLVIDTQSFTNLASAEAFFSNNLIGIPLLPGLNSVQIAFSEVPSRVVLEFGDAISGISRVSGQAARSIG